MLVVDQVISLIYFIHQNNIVHLDTHTNNFLVDTDFYVKIIDFGEYKEDTDIEYRKTDYKRFIRDITTWINEGGYINLEYLLNYINNPYGIIRYLFTNAK